VAEIVEFVTISTNPSLGVPMRLVEAELLT
jgi:hypothetical protein